MGCGCSDRSYVEDNITEMWKNIRLNDLTSSEYVAFFEKATAYKKDLRTKEVFDRILLNPILSNKLVMNQELRFLKDNHLNVATENSFEIPFALLFLTKSKDHVELSNHFDDLLTIIEGRMDNPKKLKKNMASLRIFLEFYICVISLFSIQSYSYHSGNDKTKVIDQFSKIYSKDFIKRHLERIFSFETNIRSTPNPDNLEAVHVNVKDVQDKSELLEFFKNNFLKLNPSYIRDCLFVFEREGLNSEDEIRKYQDKIKPDENNLVSARKTKTITKKIIKVRD